MENIGSNAVPVAKTFTLTDLSGWLAKSLLIPQGKNGIVVLANGDCKTLPAGKSMILDAVARFKGDGIGMQIGIIPSEPFDMGARFENLLSGDDELLDVNLLLRVNVSDAKLFFRNVVVPVGELSDLPELENESLHYQMEKLVQQYAREDLIRHIPTERLVGEIIDKNTKDFQRIGLQIIDVPLLLFRRSEDRLIIDEKLGELETQLANISNTLENEESDEHAPIEIEEIADQIFPESAGLRSSEMRDYSEAIADIQNFQKLDQNPKQRWLLKLLQTPKTDDVNREIQKNRRKWRLQKIFWIIFILLLGFSISELLNRFNLPDKERNILYAVVWVSSIFFVILLLRRNLRKNESISAYKKSMPDLENAGLIKQDDRIHADQFVREQCAKEMQHTKEVMSDSRRLIYHEGKTEYAIRIKELEKQLDDLQSKFLSSTFGVPAYLSQLAINGPDWTKVLDQEEEVLRKVKCLGTMAENFRLGTQDLGMDELKKIEEQLLLLENAFYDRSRSK